MHVSPMPWWAIGLHACGTIALARHGRRRAAAPLALALLGLVAGDGTPAEWPHVAVLDGDGIVVRGPSGRVWVMSTSAPHHRRRA